MFRSLLQWWCVCLTSAILRSTIVGLFEPGLLSGDRIDWSFTSWICAKLNLFFLIISINLLIYQLINCLSSAETTLKKKHYFIDVYYWVDGRIWVELSPKACLRVSHYLPLTSRGLGLAARKSIFAREHNVVTNVQRISKNLALKVLILFSFMSTEATFL